MSLNCAKRVFCLLTVFSVGLLLLAGLDPAIAQRKNGLAARPSPKPARTKRPVKPRPAPAALQNVAAPPDDARDAFAIRNSFEQLLAQVKEEVGARLGAFDPRPRKEVKRFDEPDKALEYYLLRRLPAGETELPLERYLEAQEQMARMPQFSTADDRLLPSRAELRNSPDQQRLGTWTWLGPGNIGGRTRAIVINPQDPNIMYAAGVSGGVWKSTNAGQSWTPVSDLLPNIPVSSLSLDPANPSVIYAGTGEGYSIGSVNNVNITGAHRGLGIFKSTDASATWTRLPGTDNSNFYYINKLVVSKADSKRIYAATETGVWRSLDAGMTWERALNPIVSAQTITGGCLDLAIRTDQATADIVFAACGTRAQSRIYRNSDAGGAGQWAEVFTESGMGRTALAIAPSNQNVIYAVSTAFTGSFTNNLHAVFRSTAGGDPGSWTARVRNTDAKRLNAGILSIPPLVAAAECKNGFAPSYSGQGFFDLAIAVDPADENRVWTGGIDLFRSDDGGANWGIAGYSYEVRPSGVSIGKTHPDQHVIIFHPDYDGASNQQMFVGNDGGLYRTDNARAKVGTEPDAPCRPELSAVAWTALNNNYGVTQFYQGTVRPDGTSYYGGTQDNGTVRGDDAGGPNKWAMILGGDGGYGHFDFRNPTTIYASSQGVSLRKSTDDGATFTPATQGINSGGLFIMATLMDPSDSRRLYAGALAGIFRSSNGAAQWSNVTGTIPNNFVVPSALAVAPTDANWLLAGSINGLIFRTNRILDYPAVTGPAPPNEAVVRPRDGFVSWVAFDPTNKNIAYATYSTFGGAHVWRTIDGGETWSAIDGSGAGALPDIPVHCLIVDPSNTSRLYIGTDLGVFASIDGGAMWAVENTGFANVVTESLTLNVAGGATSLYAFTHGRGVFKVTANMNGCSYALATSGQSFATAGGTATVNVTAAPGGCNWKAESNASWISVTVGATGSGNGSVELKVDENKTLAPRTGTVNIAGRSFAVSQTGLPDTVAPVIEVTSPTAPVTTPLGGINITGTASDNVRVSQISWRSDRGTSGAIPGAARWTITGMPLLTGHNVITFTAQDEAGNASNTATVTATSRPTGVLVTVAGNGSIGIGSDGGQATATPLTLLYKLAFDGAGNLYFADQLVHRVRKVSPNGILTTVVGNNTGASTGDGGPAAQAQINSPSGVTVDKDGNIYITEIVGHRVRKITASTGVISTIAGTGVPGFGGDDGPATAAFLNRPEGVAVDKDGNVYIADSQNNRVRKVAPDGKISTFAGGTATALGDGGPATQARVAAPLDVAVDGNGNLFIADTSRIRKVDAAGIITTVAGNGNFGATGDGGPATAAALSRPASVALDAAGNIAIADQFNYRIRVVTAAGGVINTVAGGGEQGFTPDLVGAVGARLNFLLGVGFDPVGTLHFSDTFNFVIRKVILAAPGDTTPPVVQVTAPTTAPTYIATEGSLTLSGTATDASPVAQLRWSNDRGGSGVATGTSDWTIRGIGLSNGQNVITVTAWDAAGNGGSAQLTVNYAPQQTMVTLAGTGETGAEGDGGPGTTARLNQPAGVAVDAAGNVYVADTLNHRVRKIDSRGRITAFAGNGDLGSSGDAGPALDATMNVPVDVAIDAGGAVYISDLNLNRVRKVTPDGKIASVAGTGVSTFGGDGGPGKDAAMSAPRGIAVDAAGNLYIADSNNLRIRKVNASDGRITTIAGNGEFGFGGDGGPATQATLGVISDVAVDSAGNLYLADVSNQRIRRVSASDGKIETIAGTGTPGYNGDGIAAKEARISLGGLSFMTFDLSGDLYFADSFNHRIRKITIGNGMISTVAGTGVAGSAGESNSPTGVNLQLPAGVALDVKGNLYVGDNGNNRVRRTQSASGLLALSLASAASFSTTAGVSPDSIAVAFGMNLASAEARATSLPLPIALDDTTLRVRDSLGVERMAPLFFVSAEQANFLVPAGTATGVATAILTNRQGEKAIGGVGVASVAPGLFAANANGQGVAAAVVLRIRADGTLRYEPVARFDPAQNRFVPEPIDLGPEGDQVFLAAFGSGFRSRTALANVSATVGGEAAPVLFAGAQNDLIGVDQANVRLLRSLIGRGEVDLVLTVDGRMSNMVRIAIR